MNYLLDSDTCIAFIKGAQSVREGIKKVTPDACFVSEITIAELYFGAYNGNNPQARLSEVSFIENAFNVVPIYPTLSTYAQEKVRLRRAGLVIPDFDLLIGTASVHLGMTLVSGNTKHMSRIQNVVLENWMRP